MTKKTAYAALLASAVAALSAVPAVSQTLEPSADTFAKAAASGKPIYELPYDGARSVLKTVQAETVAASAPTTTEDHVWKIGPTGQVRIRIVRPADASGTLPGVLYFHGGGWVMGDRTTHDHLIRELAVQSRAAVVFVEYDNAPEVRYPVNNEQAYAALEYVAGHGSQLRIDPKRLAVAGDSAGGNMAIAVTMMAKDRKGPTIRHQLLFYPVTDNVSDDASYQAFANGPFLTRKAMEYFIKANYPAASRNDALAFPLRASVEQLSGLPKATILVAENDVLRDEGEAYGRKLVEAGVPVLTARYNATMHDFVMLNPLARSEQARSAIAQGAQRLRTDLEK